MLTNLDMSPLRNRPEASSLKGFTLLEVLITIVVLAIAATAIMSVYISTIKTSADPLIQQQAVSIAEAYMEEIQSKSFDDPTGVEAGETRATFDDVDDYHDLSEGVKDQSGNAIAGLSGYTVSVSVVAQALNGIPSVNSKRIDVTVSHSAISAILLSGFRVKH